MQGEKAAPRASRTERSHAGAALQYLMMPYWRLTESAGLFRCAAVGARFADGNAAIAAASQPWRAPDQTPSTCFRSWPAESDVWRHAVTVVTEAHEITMDRPRRAAMTAPGTSRARMGR